MSKNKPNRFNSRIFNFVKKYNSYNFALASSGIIINTNTNTNTNTNNNTDYIKYIIDF